MCVLSMLMWLLTGGQCDRGFVGDVFVGNYAQTSTQTDVADVADVGRRLAPVAHSSQVELQPSNCTIR